MSRKLRACLVSVVFMSVASAGCTMKKQEAPALTGPSEFGTSITVQISPDVITQDGASQAVVTITARDANAAPARNLVLRAEISVDGVLADFGTLSARTVATGSDGRATLTYTAPAAVFGGTTSVVDILVTPSGTDFNNSVARSAAVRLVPQGIVLPPAGLQAAFTFTPTTPSDGQSVVFDATSSTAPANNPIAEFRWNFGDGRTATGPIVTHAFSDSGAFPVTLTVIDAFGRAASRVQTIQVSVGAGPTADFVSSPTTPLANEPVHFNASASKAPAGKSIASFRWDFGDGDFGSGQTTTHEYDQNGDYTVTLTVTDTSGKTATKSSTVTVGNDAPTAAFTFSPTAPTVGVNVSFNGSGSTAVAGRTITSYSWSFGDGGTASGQAVTHAFAAAGVFTVTLTVVDSASRSGSTTQTVTVTVTP
jgi:PKD repeat protein